MGFLSGLFKKVTAPLHILGSVGGTVIGNLLLPGVGGIIGGVVGGIGGSAVSRTGSSNGAVTVRTPRPIQPSAIISALPTVTTRAQAKQFEHHHRLDMQHKAVQKGSDGKYYLVMKAQHPAHTTPTPHP